MTATGAHGNATKTSHASNTVAARGTGAPVAPDNTVVPAVTGPTRSGGTLTADPGAWTGTAPIGYSYRWRRCDASGANCTEMAGATDRQYTLTSADVGHTIRVEVTARNDTGATTKSSEPTGVIAATAAAGGGATPVPTTPRAPATPAAPAVPSRMPSTGSTSPSAPVTPANAASDLSTLPGSQITSTSCAALVGGGGFRRLDFPPAGVVRMRIRADATVLPTAPVRITVNAAKPAGLCSVRYTLDGRAVRSGRRAPYRLALAPSALKPGRHALVARLRPRTGRARTLTTTLRIAGCATRFTARQYHTTGGTGIRLRVDSRTATSSVVFTLPSAIARGLALGTPAGRIRIVTRSGRHQFTLRPARGTRPAGLAAGAGRAGVHVRGRTIAVSALSPATGIVELTVYQPRPPRGARLLSTSRRISATATIRTPAARRLTARVVRGGG